MRVRSACRDCARLQMCAWHAAHASLSWRVMCADRYATHHPLSPTKRPLDMGHSYFAVFDGHGGEWAADYMSGMSCEQNSVLHHVADEDFGCVRTCVFELSC
jgi:hypothetical protein